MARKRGQIPCDIERFARTMVLLGEERKTRITELGSEGMLSVQAVKLRHYLLYSILANYDAIEEKVTFGSGHSFTISSGDVDVIMGLEDKGSLVQPDDNIATEQIPDKYKVGKSKDGLCIFDLITIMFDKGPPDEDFDRSFVLFLLGTVLAPVSWDHIPYSYYSIVEDPTKIKDMNWNQFTLRFLKDSLATLKEGPHSDRWPSGNLALLQYTYWEKIRPCHSNLMFSERTPPLVKYWNEDVAVERDIYDISHGRSSITKVVDDLRKENTIDHGLQNDMITPTSMLDNNSEEFRDIPKRRTYLEKTMAQVLKNDNNLVRCLEPAFNNHEDACKSGSMAGKDNKEDSTSRSAAMVSQKKKRKNY